jgi:ABC-2 type transport system permease protein
MNHNLNAIATIAYRDFAKFLRDRSRILATFIFPFVFIGILGNSLQSNLGQFSGYNFLVFTFTGVLAQTLFQSTASGIISLIEDRENDFSQEIFVSPVSRYTIVIGKIIGETAVSIVQGLGVLFFGLIIGIPFSIAQFIAIVPFALVCCILGGAFGLLVLGNLNSQRAANQIFPFVIFPQFFLSGVFSPIKDLPLPLMVLSRISPMTYAVDLIRSVYYANSPEYSKIVLNSTAVNLAVCTAMIVVFVLIGTVLFVRKEKNR